MARWTAKVVSFDVIILNGQGKGETLTKTALSPMETSVQRISQSLDDADRDQRHLRVREQKHRDTAESTNGRVLWYSVIESMILVAVSAGQVYYLRKFFEVKRSV